jgi:hypothetical protein
MNVGDLFASPSFAKSMAIGSMAVMLADIEATTRGAAAWAVITWLCPPKPFRYFQIAPVAQSVERRAVNPCQRGFDSSRERP